jgi:hypothetical protein
MCIIFKEDLERILDVLVIFVNENKLDILDKKDELKDYLSGLRDTKKIEACGCDGVFDIKTENTSVFVYMEILGIIYKFIIDDNPKYVLSSFSEVIPNYDDIIENDCLDL